MSIASSVQQQQRDRMPKNGHVHVVGPLKDADDLPQSLHNKPIIGTTKTNSVCYAQQQLGVSLSEGLKKAYDECKAKVERIAMQCRAKNRKFR